MKQLSLKNKKGFTLVELIVVIVILAALAAFLIPSLAGFIQRANNSVIMAEARSALLAMQTMVSEDYAGGTALPADSADGTFGTAGLAAAKILGEYPGTVTSVEYDKGRVMTFTYANVNNSKYVIYTVTGGIGKYGEVQSGTP
ncbi:MAG: type II secretion system GspH family protein [Clostridiales bacterium]|nr:type II secretion system GspH family protein [Clostridiales bacterium]